MEFVKAQAKQLHSCDYRRPWMGVWNWGMRSGMDASPMMMNFVARYQSEYDDT